MDWIVFICVVYISLPIVTTANKCDCRFTKHQKNVPAKDLKQLEPLCGKRYRVNDELAGGQGYSYSVGICTTAELTPNPADPNMKSAAVLQTNETSNGKTQYILGDLNNAEIMTGTNWIYLEYEEGHKFGTHCNSEARRSVIMITCKPGETQGTMRWLEENSQKTADCYYLFELEHEAACSPEPIDNSLSSGSIICIILATVVGVYLVIGTLYMRLIRRAKGLNQIPNYNFWKDFGSLQADGCDFVCRCGGRTIESKQYHGIGDHQIECANDGDLQDDHLLPM